MNLLINSLAAIKIIACINVIKKINHSTTLVFIFQVCPEYSTFVLHVHRTGTLISVIARIIQFVAVLSCVCLRVVYSVLCCCTAVSTKRRQTTGVQETTSTGTCWQCVSLWSSVVEWGRCTWEPTVLWKGLGNIASIMLQIRPTYLY